jgi:ribulose-bisphosphate carboxylase small chain
MHITQGQFSFLPPLTDDEIRTQVDYAISNGWAVSIEWTDDPHPRNVYWNMWEQPMFEIKDGAAVIYDLEACRKACPNAYIKVNAFNSTRGVESMVVMSFIVNRPEMEPGFGLIRQEGEGRTVHYTTRAYSTETPPGSI